jgi:hypothetical protein
MSLGGLAVGEAAIAAQDGAKPAATKKPPRNRLIVAKADVIAQPEPR